MFVCLHYFLTNILNSCVRKDSLGFSSPIFSFINSLVFSHNKNQFSTTAHSVYFVLSFFLHLLHPGSSSAESTHLKYSQSPPRESPTEPSLRESYIEFPVGESYNDPPLRENYNGTIASRSPPPLRQAFSSTTLRHLIKKHNDSSGRERFNNPPLQDIFNDPPGRSPPPEYAISKHLKLISCVCQKRATGLQWRDGAHLFQHPSNRILSVKDVIRKNCPSISICKPPLI
jgi:hypothetical protein